MIESGLSVRTVVCQPLVTATMNLRVQSALLAVATFLERWAWNGLRAGFVLVLVQLWPGDPQAEQGALRLHSWVAALVFALAIGFGWLAQRAASHRTFPAAGLVTMAVGYLVLAVWGGDGLYLGLALLVLGRSAVLPTLRALLGDLYEAQPQDVSDRAFTRVYLA